jgi:hypothetical protein
MKRQKNRPAAARPQPPLWIRQGRNETFSAALGHGGAVWRDARGVLRGVVADVVDCEAWVWGLRGMGGRVV